MRTIVQLPTGLIETTPAGSVPLTFYDDGLNVRDWDERGQRARLATRAGNLRLGTGNPCPDGSPVVHSVTAKQAVSRFEFAELTTTPAADTSPTQVSETFSTDLGAKPLASSVGPDGIWHVLLSSGAVVTVDADGNLSDAFAVQIPQSFELVPSMVIDPFGGVIVAVRFARQIDGSASRFLRYRRDEDSEWEQTYTEAYPDVVERFWGADGELFAAVSRPDNVEEGAEYELARLGGVQASRYSVAWSRPIAWPVVDVRGRDGDLFVSAGPNRSRQGSPGSSGASVSWTPRELAGAARRLFGWLSALRAQNVQGYTDGASVTRWEDARQDDSDFDEILDDTERSAVDASGRLAPKFGVTDKGPEITFSVSPEGGANAELLRTARHNDLREKGTSAEAAPWQRGLVPAMRDEGSDGARFAITGLVRLENYEEGDVLFTDWKTVFSHGELSLEYRGETDVELRLNVPGSVQPTLTRVVTGANVYVCFTILFNGANLAGSSWRVNGTAVESLTVTDTPSTLSRTRFGFAPDDALRPASRMRGGWKEFIPYLGLDSSGVHNVAPLQSEIEQFEGFACNAYDVQDILAAGHPWNNGAPPGAGGTVPGLDFEDAFAVPDGLTIKLDRSSGDVRWVHGGPDAGAGLALDSEDAVYSIGTPLDVTAVDPDRLSRLTDNGDSFAVDWSLKGGTGQELIWPGGAVPMYVDGCENLYVPWHSIGTVTASELRKYDPTGALLWSFAMVDAPRYLGPGGLRVDDRFRGGPCGDEYLFATSVFGRTAKRIEILGRRDTGETREQITEELAVCASGIVSRLEGGAWVTQASDFTPGARPWSFQFFSQLFLGGPEDYRVFDIRNKTLREWTPKDGSLIPPRIVDAIRWRGRVLCVSSDNPHILFGSAFNDAFDFATGGEIISATQAFAGTTAAAGSIPDPVTALIAASDDLAYVGTTRSVWRLTGDPQTGGQIDDVIANEGILGRTAHCRGDMGEIYWLTTTLRVVRMAGAGMEDISSGMIRGRLRAIDRELFDVQLVWSQEERGLYVVPIAREGSEGESLDPIFWSARTGRWHPHGFGGGYGRRVTSAANTESPEAGGWGVAFGFADGGLRYVHRGALDDDGVAIPWRVRIPLGGDGDPMRSLVTHAEVVLAPDQGPCMAQGLGGSTGQTPTSQGIATSVMPGRPDFVPVQIAEPHTWLELSGTGTQAAVESLAVNIHQWGAN